MNVTLNHTIVNCTDKHASARFLVDILGLLAPTTFGPFVVVQVDNKVSLDFADDHGKPRSQHYAFLVSEHEFDQIHARITERGLTCWGRPVPPPGGPDQHQRRRARPVLERPRRSQPGDHHRPVRRLIPGGRSPMAARRHAAPSGNPTAVNSDRRT